MIDYKKLMQYCKTDRQREVLEAVITEQSQSKASVKLGISRGTMSNIMNAIYKHQRKEDNAAYEDAPIGYQVKGVSTLYGANGEIKQQWVKTDRDKEEQEALVRAVIEELKEDVPKHPIVLKDKVNNNDNLLNFYTITDYHLGMFANKEDSGEDWNTETAFGFLVDHFQDMILRSPDAGTSVLNIQGDFMHTDSLKPVTPGHGHILDTDVRFSKLIRVSTNLIRIMMNELIQRSNKVILLIAQGNHDLTSALWLQEVFNMYYENVDTVEVIVDGTGYYCIEHGKTMLVVHHGHRASMGRLGQIVPSLFPKQWGNTTYRYAHMGHYHHKEVKENFGITVEMHPSLSADDAYGVHGGWNSNRGANVITYDSKYGEVSRITTRPQFVN